jgi:hypothetical protein
VIYIILGRELVNEIQAHTPGAVFQDNRVLVLQWNRDETGDDASRGGK